MPLRQHIEVSGGSKLYADRAAPLHATPPIRQDVKIPRAALSQSGTAACCSTIGTGAHKPVVKRVYNLHWSSTLPPCRRAADRTSDILSGAASLKASGAALRIAASSGISRYASSCPFVVCVRMVCLGNRPYMA